jgi:hypothetical protein
VDAALRSLNETLARDGFAFVEAAAMRALLESVGPLSDGPAFAASWDDLALDTFMADGGRYRRRRHATFAAERSGPTARQPHAPHFQGREYNPLNGGVERWFEPMAEEIGAGPTLSAVLELGRALANARVPDAAGWHIEVHQFRIEAGPGAPGQPTPEGLHRDGVDFVLVLMVDRQNIASGVTTIHDLHRRELGSFTLAAPFDAALVDDARVFHGVTAVQPLDPAKPAHRDVLVATWRAR